MFVFLFINKLSQVLGLMRRHESLHECISIYVPSMYNVIYCVNFTMTVPNSDCVSDLRG